MGAEPTELLEFDLERRFSGVGRLYGQAGAQRIFKAHVLWWV